MDKTIAVIDANELKGNGKVVEIDGQPV